MNALIILGEAQNLAHGYPWEIDIFLRYVVSELLELVAWNNYRVNVS